MVLLLLFAFCSNKAINASMRQIEGILPEAQNESSVKVKPLACEREIKAYQGFEVRSVDRQTDGE
jgi:hypothetical protein